METANKVFLNIFDGFFEVRLKDPAPGAAPVPGSVSRVNKNGKTIHVLRYNALKGMLRGISKKTVENMGDFYSFLIEEDKMYQLDLQANSSSTFYFISRLVQIDPTKPFSLKVFATVEEDKKKTIILVYQGSDTAIKGLWTKEHPNGCPDLKKVRVKGKDVWDDTERMEFVEKYMNENLKSKIVAPIEVTAKDSAPVPEEVGDEPEAPEWLDPSATPAK